MSTWNLPPGVSTNNEHINPDDREPETILEACDYLGLDYPVSAADLHKVYLAFQLAGIEPWTIQDSPCWRGVCDCLELYSETEPLHIQKRAPIVEHLEYLCSRRRDTA